MPQKRNFSGTVPILLFKMIQTILPDKTRLPHYAAALLFVSSKSCLGGTKCGMLNALKDILESITAAAQKN